jgi:capsular polysaccharide biosynthesis protein
MSDFLKIFILAIISLFLFCLLDTTIKIQKQNQQIIELLQLGKLGE